MIKQIMYDTLKINKFFSMDLWNLLVKEVNKNLFCCKKVKIRFHQTKKVLLYSHIRCGIFWIFQKLSVQLFRIPTKYKSNDLDFLFKYYIKSINQSFISRLIYIPYFDLTWPSWILSTSCLIFSALNGSSNVVISYAHTPKAQMSLWRKI